MTREERDNYIPYPHSYLAGLYRIPVWVEGDEYAISVGAKTYRYFTSENVPERIKALLSMIHAIPYKPRESHDMTPHQSYVNMQDPRLDEIGWRVSDTLYILVLGEGFLFDLHRGLNG